MALIKVIQHGQITLPAKLRDALHLQEGNYLEAELEGGRIVLKPKVVLDKTAAVDRLPELMDEVQARNTDVDDEELEGDVQAAVEAVRRENVHDSRGA